LINIQKRGKQEMMSLAEELKKKLEWYTLQASEEEYDEKAVESILYLLDNMKPIKEEDAPQADKAWEQFQKYVKQCEGTEAACELGIDVRKISGMKDAASGDFVGRNVASGDYVGRDVASEEYGRRDVASGDYGRKDAASEDYVGRDAASEEYGRRDAASEECGRRDVVSEEYGRRDTVSEDYGRKDKISENYGGNDAVSEKSEVLDALEIMGKPGKTVMQDGMEKMGKPRKPVMQDGVENQEEPGNAPDNYSSASCKGSREMGGFILHYKYIAAVLAVLLVLSVLGTARAVADGNTGFFHWLRNDHTGTQMVTSPDDLSGVANKEEAYFFYHKEDVPEWAQEWLKIDSEFDMPEGYEWQSYEIREFSNFRKITSIYADKVAEKEINFGMVIYDGKVSLNTEGFVGYSYVETYEIEQNQMNIYCRTEETGKKYYIICFYEDNSQYFMQGPDNLDELKSMMEEYLICVKNY